MLNDVSVYTHSAVVELHQKNAEEVIHIELKTGAAFMVHFVQMTLPNVLEELKENNWSLLDDQQIFYLMDKMGNQGCICFSGDILMLQIFILCLKLQ